MNLQPGSGPFAGGLLDAAWVVPAPAYLLVLASQANHLRMAGSLLPPQVLLLPRQGAGEAPSYQEPFTSK